MHDFRKFFELRSNKPEHFRIRRAHSTEHGASLAPPLLTKPAGKAINLRILILVLALVSTPQAGAGTISYRFDGTIDRVIQYDCVRADSGDCTESVENELEQSTNYPEHTFTVGDSFSIVASWGIDPDPPIVVESDTALYLDEDLSVSVSTAGFSLPSTSFAPALEAFDQQIRVTDGMAPGSDAFLLAQVLSQTAAPGGRIFAPVASLALADSTGTALDGFAIPTSVNLDDFDSSTAAVSFIEIFDAGFGVTLLVTAKLEQATVVPLPAGAWLMGSLGLLGWLRHRSSRAN